MALLSIVLPCTEADAVVAVASGDVVVVVHVSGAEVLDKANVAVARRDVSGELVVLRELDGHSVMGLS